MSDQACQDCAEVESLVDALDHLLRGHKTAHALQAMAIMYGRMEAEADRPNIDNLLRIVCDLAKAEFKIHRATMAKQFLNGRPQ